MNRSIIARMARLSEQKSVVEAIYRSYCYETPTYENLIHYFWVYPVFSDDRIENIEVDDVRNRRITNLINACLDDRFIEPTSEEYKEVCIAGLGANAVEFQNGAVQPVKKTTVDCGYRVTSRGQDLLHFWGYTTILFEKHNRLIMFLYGVLATFVVWLVAQIFNHWDDIQNVIGLN